MLPRVLSFNTQVIWFSYTSVVIRSSIFNFHWTRSDWNAINNEYKTFSTRTSINSYFQEGTRTSALCHLYAKREDIIVNTPDIVCRRRGNCVSIRAWEIIALQSVNMWEEIPSVLAVHTTTVAIVLIRFCKLILVHYGRQSEGTCVVIKLSDYRDISLIIFMSERSHVWRKCTKKVWEH